MTEPKPRGIRWLEQQTGQEIDVAHATAPSADRHLSVRMAAGTWNQLAEVARAGNETVSQLARRLIEEGLTRRDNPDLAALDSAIASLEAIRRQMKAS